MDLEALENVMRHPNLASGRRMPLLMQLDPDDLMRLLEQAEQGADVSSSEEASDSAPEEGPETLATTSAAQAHYTKQKTDPATEIADLPPQLKALVMKRMNAHMDAMEEQEMNEDDRVRKRVATKLAELFQSKREELGIEPKDVENAVNGLNTLSKRLSGKPAR